LAAGSDVWRGQADATAEPFGRRVLRWFVHRSLLDGDDFRDRLGRGFGPARDHDPDVSPGFSPGERRGVRGWARFTGCGIAVADREAEARLVCCVLRCRI
jgi:hypothetical protein